MTLQKMTDTSAVLLTTINTQNDRLKIEFLIYESGYLEKLSIYYLMNCKSVC
ncbi:hypothetical protein D3C73_463460 [compost metagenome]